MEGSSSGKGKINRGKMIKIMRDNLKGVTKGTIRRLARRGGVQRISGLMYEMVRDILKLFLHQLIRNSILYMMNAKRNTIFATDVVYALKFQGITQYGFESEENKKL